MDGPERIRVGDDDRERYAVILRRAYAEGRITGSELEERLQHVYRSRTEPELRTVVGDLPVAALADPPQPSPSLPASRRVAPLLGTVMGWYFPALICTAIWAITDFGGYFWPVWVFFGLSIPAGFALVGWLSGDEGDDDGDDAGPALGPGDDADDDR